HTELFSLYLFFFFYSYVHHLVLHSFPTRLSSDLTLTGKEVTSFLITQGVDDITNDAATKRVYAACDGAVDIYEQSGPDSYKLLANIPTGPMGRTARLVPELKRYFVAVPQHDTTSAKVLVFEVL